MDQKQKTGVASSATMSPAEVFHVLRRFWKFVRPYRAHFFLAILLLMFAVPFAQFALFLTRDVTNQALVATDKSVDERWAIVIRIVVLQAAFTVGSALLWIMREVLEWYVSMRATFDARLAFYRHLLRLPLSFLRQRPPGEHLYRSTTDFYMAWNQDGYDAGVAGMIVREIPQLIETVYTLAWGAVFLYLIDPTLMWILIVYIVPYALAAHFMYTRVRDAQLEMRHQAEVESSVLRDSIVGLRAIKSMGRDLYQLKKYAHAAISMRRKNILLLFRTTIADQGLLWFIRFGFTSGIYIYITLRVMQGKATVGDWLTAFLILAAAQLPMEKCVQIVQRIRVQMVPAQRILETLDVNPEFDDIPNAFELKDIAGKIQFENVSLEYIAGRKSLNGVSLTIEPGEFIGFVGPSGAGKSSVLSLLLRLYLPTEGVVLVDGHDLKEIKLDSFLKAVGVVPQSTYLYDGTIADNIRFGKLDASDQEVQKACLLSGAEVFIANQPDGLDSWITEGARLSGGERQRIGIARALIRDPKVLLLDEATANLDPITEHEVLQTINAIRSGRTVISVAHRLKSVVPCDRIVVMDDGRIVDIGHHDALLTRCSLYREMWDQQNSESVVKGVAE